MCGSAETTQKSKRSRSHIPAKHVVLHIKKQLRRVSGAEERNQHKHHADWMKQLRRVSGAEERNQHKHHADWMKQLRRVSGAEEKQLHLQIWGVAKQLRRVSGVNNYHKILTIII